MKNLTDRQDKFAFAVGAEGRNHSDAYREFYNTVGWLDASIHNSAAKLVANPMVAARIEHFRKSRAISTERTLDMTVKKLMETYVAIALVDPNELIAVRIGCCRHCHGEGFGYQWREREYLAAVAKAEGEKKPTPLPDIGGGFGFNFTLDPHPECPECQGEGVSRLRPMDTTKLSAGAKHLYRGAQQTKEGMKILFGDKDKALENIGRMLGAFDDKLRVDLNAQVKALQLTTTDPAQAALDYQKMVAGG